MNSQVQNGMVKVGYTTTSDHSESCSPRQRQEQQGRRHQIGQEDADAEVLGAASRHAGEAVAGGQRDQERDRYDAQPDERGVPHPLHEEGFLEQISDVLQRRRGVEPVGIGLEIVEVAVGLERRQQHPIERKRSERDQHDHRAIERSFAQEPCGEPRHVRSPGAGARAT
jgi:hypothetical protein